MKFPLFVLCLALGLSACGAASAQLPAGAPPAAPPALPSATSPDYLAAMNRWRSSLSAFASADKEKLPATDGVLFVGSSTIRMWTHLAQDFRQSPVVINRGFGGSTMADCSLFTHELVVRYRPRHVLVYAGDNDLAEGRTPLQVLESFAQFANTVRETLPEARISYISIKPSPSREALMPKIRSTNDIIAAYVRTMANAEYIDIFTPMLGADGRPRAELFLGDRLHMNETGYRLWQSVISAHVTAPETLAASPAPRPVQSGPGTPSGLLSAAP
ncbi:SGNH/GDSL hydrolase family protein [Variovorax boronicumulans]|uniref:SGNH/GDSL hydrolase family protein n=1 Tax=Variovorax boronicumulans TaxID=436515 RepID=UPI001C5942DB